MRKLKLQVQMTLDGFVGAPNGELNWMTWNWTDDLKKYVSDLTEPVDTIILGRKLAQGFIPHWANTASKPGQPEELAFAKKMTDTPKVVFTKTLAASEWGNTDLAKGDLVAEVTALKQKPGKDIIVYGGSTFVASLISAGLIDEYHLFINPTAIGQGLQIFQNLAQRQSVELVKAQPFDCGVVVLNYRLKK